MPAEGLHHHHAHDFLRTGGRRPDAALALDRSEVLPARDQQVAQRAGPAQQVVRGHDRGGRRDVVVGELELAGSCRQQLGELVAVRGPHDRLGVLVQPGDDVGLVQQEIDIGLGRLRIERIGQGVGGQRMPRLQALGLALRQALDRALAVEHQPHRARIVAGHAQLGDVALGHPGVAAGGLDRATDQAFAGAGDQREVLDIDHAAAQRVLAHAQRFVAPRERRQPQVQRMPAGLLPRILRLQVLRTEECPLPPMDLPITVHAECHSDRSLKLCSMPHVR